MENTNIENCNCKKVLENIYLHCEEEIKKLVIKKERAGLLNKAYYESLIERYQKIKYFFKEEKENENN